MSKGRKRPQRDMYGNTRTLGKIEESKRMSSIVSDTDELSKKCKFNFHYFTVQTQAGQGFSGWDHNELINLMDKLKTFSEKSLEHWGKLKLGSSQGYWLQIYDSFPPELNTDFTEPLNIPIEARWARFRLQNKVRVIGFILEEKYHDVTHQKTKYLFDKNTFYVVFLDKDHKFWKSEEE